MARSLLHQYWDLPEGTECHRKAYASTSVGGAAGLIVSAYSIALKPPASFLEGVARTGRYTFTAAAIGAIFGLTTCVSAQVRGKPDDPLNYLIGGCAGGLTLGARASGPAGGETRPHADKPPWPSSGSAWWKVPAGREGRAPRREAHASPGDLRQGLGVPCTPGPAMGGEPQARQADPSSAAMLQRAGRSVPPAPGPRGSSQLRDRSRRLRLHGPHGRPGQDGPAGGLGGVRRAQSVSPRPGPHSPDCV
uniref:NADH dehydrogenase [ubiquinone] 1 alpha subcomplex subunit 11 n=1 Tax=Equus caballus TaxID=9796 RepID=A0A9L0RV09_HORSE